MNAKQERVIHALLSGATVRDIADEFGVSTKTLYRWMREDAFKTRVREESDAIFEHTRTRLTALLDRSVGELEAILSRSDASDRDKLRAIGLVFDQLWKFKSRDLEDRLARIETILNEPVDNGNFNPVDKDELNRVYSVLTR